MFFYWKKNQKDEHVQLGMNINRTEGGQSKQTPGGQSPRLHSPEKIDMLTVRAQRRTKDKNIYGYSHHCPYPKNASM